jgi:hypothetical protein
MSDGARIIDLMEALKRSLAEQVKRVPVASEVGTCGPAKTDGAGADGGAGQPWAPKRYRGSGPKPVRKGQAKLW